jgi:hypothetical protein
MSDDSGRSDAVTPHLLSAARDRDRADVPMDEPVSKDPRRSADDPGTAQTQPPRLKVEPSAFTTG